MPIREPVEYPEHDDSGNEDILASEGTITDYITDREVKDSPKERVRQRIPRALFHEYGFPRENMESDFPIPVEVGGKKRRKKVEIAIFDYDKEHTLESLRRVVVCRPEPKNGKKGVTKLHDHQQAANDLEELKEFMTAVPTCQYSLWTNGLDMFFLRKEILVLILSSSHVPIGRWLTNHRGVAQSYLMLAYGVLTRRCCVWRSGAVTTSSTGTKAYPRMPPSGSSFISSFPRCMTSGAKVLRVVFMYTPQSPLPPREGR
jgi:hypothetical protein